MDVVLSFSLGDSFNLHQFGIGDVSEALEVVEYLQRSNQIASTV
jgi:hypothetical protein